MLVSYIAVRDNSGKYVGTTEVVQDMEFAKEHFQTYEIKEINKGLPHWKDD